jgi:hypothetical protein
MVDYSPFDINPSIHRIDIDGQTYLSFEDYNSWKSRKVKGNLSKLQQKGLVTASWNHWIAEHGNEKPVVAEVSVRSLTAGIDAEDYYSCPQNTETQIRRREELLADIRLWSFKPDRREKLVQESWTLLKLRLWIVWGMRRPPGNWRNGIYNS